jgi:cytochrome c biogenesis protein CcdA
MEWITAVFESSEFGIAILPASFLLGLLTTLGSCVNWGIFGAVVGFAGSRDESFNFRDALLTSLFFFVGTIASLAVLGLLAGYLGKIAGENFGRYGTIAAAFAAILFGLATLKILPFKIPSVNIAGWKRAGGWLGASIFGLAVGAASLTVTMGCCGPLLPVVLGIAAAKGQLGWGALILTMFAVGYSLPLALLMLGIGAGRVTSFAQKAIKPIRIVAGTALVLVGFWLLATI